jgi:hypothetical protein
LIALGIGLPAAVSAHVFLIAERAVFMKQGVFLPILEYQELALFSKSNGNVGRYGALRPGSLQEG